MTMNEPTTPGDQREAKSVDLFAKLLGYGFASLIFIPMVYGVGSAVLAENKELASTLSKLAPYLLSAAIVAVVAVVAMALYPPGLKWLKESKFITRATLFFVIVLPLLISVVGGVVLLDSKYQAVALRSGFLAVVCFLPATMWYLFLVTRKASLLNEFIANLARLGLLQQAFGEDERARERRIRSYLQKFEAIYGDLPPEIFRNVIEDKNAELTGVASGVATLFTTAIPVMLFTILVALGWLMTLPPAEIIPAKEWIDALKLQNAPVKFAFIGAYFFSLQMLFRRYVLKDLGGSAYVSASIRIILAVIGVWALSSIFDGENQKSLMIAGFVIGVFPRVVWQIISSYFKKLTQNAVPSMVSDLPINSLDGLTVWHEARLEEEDIENMPNMATADLVELFLNTRFPPERIIDWMDQAILYTQLGPQGGVTARDTLRQYGVRTATSLLRASAEFEGKQDAFQKILTDSKGNSRMPALEASLTTNSNLRLIQRWRDTRSVRAAPPAPTFVTSMAPTPPTPASPET